jgi:hypothetical protein
MINCQAQVDYLKPAINLLRNRLPGQLVIQYTDRCNALCPQCGMRSSETYKRSKLDIDIAKRIIDHAATQGISALSLTGGEPFIYLDEILELIRYASSAGIRYTRTGTNGFLFMHHNRPDFEKNISIIAELLAKSGLYTFWISIDSAIASIHEQMRGLPGVIAGIEKALPIFHEFGIYPAANLGINRCLNRISEDQKPQSSIEFYLSYMEAFSKFYTFVTDLGFTMANACYPMSISDNLTNGLKASYSAVSAASLVQYNADEKALLFRALLDTIPLFRSKIRIFSPLSSLYSLVRQYTSGEEACYPCRGGQDFFFVDAKEGMTYPCGYRGAEPLGKFWNVKLEASSAATCKKCDWECFRDPSELFGPLAEIISNPVKGLNRLRIDPCYTKLWLKDLSYFRACGYFNAAKPPDFKKLDRFKPKPSRNYD